MNKITMEKQSYLIDKTDVNSIAIPLEGGGVFIENPHLTKVFLIITARIAELEKKFQELNKEK